MVIIWGKEGEQISKILSLMLLLVNMAYNNFLQIIIINYKSWAGSPDINKQTVCSPKTDQSDVGNCS